jgi:signal peptide peptidase SppA
MPLTDVLNQPWAILPAKLLEIQGIYAAHLRGEVIDVEAIEARIGRPLQNQQQGYTVQNGIAVLPVFGVIAKRMNLLMEISGGTSTQLAQRDFQAAVSDSEVREIVLLIDSPGGEVSGIEQFANAISAARGVKPVTALIDGIGASAAYWLASAASRVYVADQTTVVGSIGVVAQHMDSSQRDAKEGVKVTEITAGKYKRIASDRAPLSEEGRQTIQDQVDAIYSVFVDAVAKNRGVSADTVLKNMADGRMFIGKQAIQAGLVDGIATMDQLIADKSKRLGSTPSVTAKVTAPATPQLAPKPQIPVTQPKPEPGYDPELIREAQALVAECGTYGIPINVTDAIDHLRVSKQGASMNSQQIARGAQIEQARLRRRGIFVTAGEAVRRVSR